MCDARVIRALFFQPHAAIWLFSLEIPGIQDRNSKTRYYCGMQVYLANPRGFCAGVDRAIEIVERALEIFGAPIYVRHEVVHNRFVVDDLRNKGAVFVDELDQVPPGATVIFSAHGVSRAVREEATRRGLNVFDATCPLVTKVHMEVVRHRHNGTECILIGHAGHPEVEGTMGQADTDMHLVESVEDVARLEVRDASNLAYVTQTTLSMDDTTRIVAALRARFPDVKGPKKDDICYATQNRQDAVKALAKNVDVMLVVGSANSSNSNRLREVAEGLGVRAYMIDAPEDIRREWLAGVHKIGLTAGASAPEVLVQKIVARLQEWGVQLVQENPGNPESVSFPIPKALRSGSVR
jgi:4-hydroxy-3-methylbut-2-enyl diphosphate reductase